LEEIGTRSRELLEKANAPRLVDKAVLFVDKERNSGEVVKLVGRLQGAITRYQVSGGWLFTSNMTYTAGQVSQQQAIYTQVTMLTVRIL